VPISSTQRPFPVLAHPIPSGNFRLIGTLEPRLWGSTAEGWIDLPGLPEKLPRNQTVLRSKNLFLPCRTSGPVPIFSGAARAPV